MPSKLKYVAVPYVQMAIQERAARESMAEYWRQFVAAVKEASPTATITHFIDDEYVVECPQEDVEKVSALFLERMPDLKVPLTVEPNLNRRWSKT